MLQANNWCENNECWDKAMPNQFVTPARSMSSEYVPMTATSVSTCEGISVKRQYRRPNPMRVTAVISHHSHQATCSESDRIAESGRWLISKIASPASHNN